MDFRQFSQPRICLNTEPDAANSCDDFYVVGFSLTALSGLIVYSLFWRSYGKNKVETQRSLLPVQ